MRVYDACENRWIAPGSLFAPYWWGDSHRERWFVPPDYWGEGWFNWLLLPPKIEFPPFSDEIAFRVARTGSCLRLREEPGEDGPITGCLPDGERLVLAEPDGDRDERGLVHPSVATARSGFGLGPTWVYVRTEGGTEGWVSHDYLEHD